MTRGQSWASRLPHRVRSVLALALLVASGSCRAPDSTQLVVGIQSDPMGGIVTDEVVKPPRGSRVGFPQPWEKALSGAGKGAARVDVEVDAIGDPSAPAPLLRRLSSTHFAPGHVALLRVPLESRCVVYPVIPRGQSKVPGPLSGPTCTAPATCIMGACLSPEVPISRLEPYAKNWPSNAPTAANL